MNKGNKGYKFISVSQFNLVLVKDKGIIELHLVNIGILKNVTSKKEAFDYALRKLHPDYPVKYTNIWTPESFSCQTKVRDPIRNVWLK